MWTPEFDPAAYHAAAERIFAEIRKAVAAGENSSFGQPGAPSPAIGWMPRPGR